MKRNKAHDMFHDMFHTLLRASDNRFEIFAFKKTSFSGIFALKSDQSDFEFEPASGGCCGVKKAALLQSARARASSATSVAVGHRPQALPDSVVTTGCLRR
jgi:hypothetical protein